ncbi:gustatory receptor-like Holozoa isoform 2-T2 [Glossina fuscipes fuscipes]
MTEIIIDDRRNGLEPTSVLLDYCRRRFIQPYTLILSVVALSPISTDTTYLRTIISYMHSCLVIITLIFGYYLQYLSTYRFADSSASNRKETYTIQKSTLSTREPLYIPLSFIYSNLAGFIIPSTLHLFGYVSAIIVWKLFEQEQQKNLIERVFLMTKHPKRLCRSVWLLLTFEFAIFILLYMCSKPVNWRNNEWLQKLDQYWQLKIKIILSTILFMQEFLEIIILSNYCVESYLLCIYITSLSEKLLLHSLDILHWMRETQEFYTLLHRLNHYVSIPVGFLFIKSTIYAISSCIHIFGNFGFLYSHHFLWQHH